ncbi:MAG: Major facilitator superfamily [Pseudonocardiales bacterium]|nr:Major facilitator superfamily [Pseudonocardiales bacterium]
MAWFLVQAGVPPVVVTILYVCGSAPQLLLGLPAGVLGDKVGHRISIVAAELAAAGVLATLAVLFALGITGSVPVLVVAAALGSADTLRQANLQAMVRLGPKHDQLDTLPAGSTASIASLNIAIMAALLCGAVIGGALYPVLHPGWLFAVGAVAHATASITLRSTQRGRTQPAPDAGGVAAALMLIRSSPLVRDLFVVVIGVEICLFSTVALLPVFTKEVLHGGSLSLGLINGCWSIGGLVTLVVLDRLRAARYDMILFASLVVGSIALLVQGLFAVVAVTGLMALILGGTLAGGDVATQTLMQRIAPSAQRGAVAGLWVVAVGFAPVGQLSAGLMASWIGVRPTIALFAIGSLVFTGLARLLPLFNTVGTRRAARRL